jgi:hypothetical protein
MAQRPGFLLGSLALVASAKVGYMLFVQSSSAICAKSSAICAPSNIDSASACKDEVAVVHAWISILYFLPSSVWVLKVQAALSLTLKTWVWPDEDVNSYQKQQIVYR